MSFKKNLAIIISLVLVLNLFPFVSFSENGTQFRDMPKDWSTEALENAVQNGLLIGYNNMIMPDDHLTRAQIATIINRAFGGDKKVTLENFTDVKSDAWYYEELQKAVQKKIFIGDGNNKFRPSDKITKEEAYVVVGRLFKISSDNHDLLEGFIDYNIINNWSKNEIAGLVASNYIDATGAINSDEYITRAEFAVLMDQLVKQYITSPGIYTTVEEGNIVVNTSGVTLEDVVITGDLIISDGVDSGELTLDNTQVLGRVIVRGGGENSIVIKGDSEIQSIIITKVDGIVRIYSEDRILIEKTIVDGSDDVILEGKFRNVEILSDNITVLAKNTYINWATIEGNNSRLVVDSESDIDQLDIRGNTVEIDGEGNVDKIFAYGRDITIKTLGTLVTAVEGSNNIDADGEDVREGKIVLTGSIEEKSTSSSNSTSSKPKLNTPVATPSGRTVNAGDAVSLSSATDGATIYYTLDGSEPTSDSTQYTDNIIINQSLTLKAIAEKAGWRSSNVLTETYVVVEEPSVFSGGNGTKDSPYQVATAEQLDKVRDYLDSYFIQTADIDLGVSPWNEGEGWEPIGNLDSDTRFRGSYDGDDFIINNLTINNPSHSYIGLFGVVGHYSTSSEIKNIMLTNITISGDSLHTVGGLAGRTESTTEINNCNSEGTINSNSLSGYAIGGLIGYNTGHLSNSSSGVDVNINSSSESYTNKIGGLVGDNNGTIEKCLSTGNITGKEQVGGLVGWNGSGNIKQSNSSGDVYGVTDVGGLVGLAWGHVQESYSIGEVSGTSNIGGLIGNLPGKVTNSYSSSNSSGNSSVGGLVGFFSGGGSPGEIVNCYSSGLVTSISIYKGGLVATIWESSSNHSIEASYWDTEMSGQSNSAGGIGYATDLMIKSANSVAIYEGWDFDTIWNIDTGNSYPYLLWQNDNNIPYPPSPFAGGTGTESDPYQVATAEQLDNVRNHIDKHFIQIADIDLGVSPWNDSDGWEPIGNDFSNTFNGTFNGNGYDINNLLINRPNEDYIGLFGINQGTLKNISLENINTKGNQYVGGLVGSMSHDAISLYGSVVNSYTSGTVLGAKYVGGLVGGSPGNYLQISESYSSVSVSGNWGVGGLVGMMYGGISNCYATGDVTGSQRVGGLVGEPYGSITNCYSCGLVSGTTTEVGGLLGYGTPSVVNSYYNSVTSGQVDTDKGTPLTTVEMIDKNSYNNWDFIESIGIWQVDISERTYPYFQWQTGNIPYATIVEPDLLGYWDFNEGTGTVVSDQSTYNNDGMIEGATWTEDMNSTTNSALAFGSNQWVDIPDSIKSEKITLAAWIYITGTDSSAAPIFSSETGHGASGFAYRLQITPDRKLRIEAVAPYTASGARVSTSTNALDLNQWYHVVGTYDGINTKLYVDGELIQSDHHGTFSNINTDANIPVGIGHLPNWASQWFRGKIDEPRVYDGALTLEEIQSLY